MPRHGKSLFTAQVSIGTGEKKTSFPHVEVFFPDVSVNGKCPRVGEPNYNVSEDD